MKRFEYIAKGGKEEIANAIAFCLTTFEETTHPGVYDCKEFIRRVEVAKENIMPWLDEEVEGK